MVENYVWNSRTAAISQVDILYLQRIFDQDALNLIKD